jgi:hypothetical protein
MVLYIHHIFMHTLQERPKTANSNKTQEAPRGKAMKSVLPIIDTTDGIDMSQSLLKAQPLVGKRKSIAKSKAPQQMEIEQISQKPRGNMTNSVLPISDPTDGTDISQTLLQNQPLVTKGKLIAAKKVLVDKPTFPTHAYGEWDCIDGTIGGQRVDTGDGIPVEGNLTVPKMLSSKKATTLEPNLPSAFHSEDSEEDILPDSQQEGKEAMPKGIYPMKTGAWQKMLFRKVFSMDRTLQRMDKRLQTVEKVVYKLQASQGKRSKPSTAALGSPSHPPGLPPSPRTPKGCRESITKGLKMVHRNGIQVCETIEGFKDLNTEMDNEEVADVVVAIFERKILMCKDVAAASKTLINMVLLPTLQEEYNWQGTKGKLEVRGTIVGQCIVKSIGKKFEIPVKDWYDKIGLVCGRRITLTVDNLRKTKKLHAKMEEDAAKLEGIKKQNHGPIPTELDGEPDGDATQDPN